VEHGIDTRIGSTQQNYMCNRDPTHTFRPLLPWKGGC
jgi:hypothetical protein